PPRSGGEVTVLIILANLGKTCGASIPIDQRSLRLKSNRTAHNACTAGKACSGDEQRVTSVVRGCWEAGENERRGSATLQASWDAAGENPRAVQHLARRLP